METSERRTPRMRALKARLRPLLAGEDWQDHLTEIEDYGLSAVGPLIACLPLEPLTRHRAAVALGRVVNRIAEAHPEDMRNIMRRLMWHMNEESGNIGWGIPEAFGEIAAACPQAGREFHRVLISYIIELEKDDNFCDQDVLRRSCYWAIGRLAQSRPDLAAPARPWLRKGAALDRDTVCCGMAAWALSCLGPTLDDMPVLRALAASGDQTPCTIFDGQTVRDLPLADVAAQALSAPAQLS